MGRIFKIKGSYDFEWRKIKHKSSFDGLIIEENDTFRGFCYEHIDEIIEIRCLIGSFSKNRENGKVGLSFAKMPYNISRYETIYTTPDITDEGLALWGVLMPTMTLQNEVRYLGHADIKLTGEEYSKKLEEKVLGLYETNRNKHDVRYSAMYELRKKTYFPEEIRDYYNKAAKPMDDELFERVMNKYAECGTLVGKWPF